MSPGQAVRESSLMPSAPQSKRSRAVLHGPPQLMLFMFIVLQRIPFSPGEARKIPQSHSPGAELLGEGARTPRRWGAAALGSAGHLAGRAPWQQPWLGQALS